MKKILLCTLLACAFATASATAGTFKLPDKESAYASVEIPDAWKPEAIDKGVQANSPDSAVYIAFEGVGTDKGVDESIDETMEMLKSNKVIVDPASQSKSTFKYNGSDAVAVDFDAKMEGEAQHVSVVFLPVNGKLVIMTFWGDKAKAKSHKDALDKMIASLKAL